MNAPFRPVETILAPVCVSIGELKKNPAAVVAAARERQVAILSRNKPVAYMISPEVWERICDVFEDLVDGEESMRRLAEDEEPVKVTIEELLAGIPDKSGAGVDQAGRDDPGAIR